MRKRFVLRRRATRAERRFTSGKVYRLREWQEIADDGDPAACQSLNMRMSTHGTPYASRRMVKEKAHR